MLHSEQQTQYSLWYSTLSFFCRSAKTNKRKSLKEKKKQYYYADERQICAEYEINCCVGPIPSFPVPVSLDDMIMTMHVGS